MLFDRHARVSSQYHRYLNHAERYVPADNRKFLSERDPRYTRYAGIKSLPNQLLDCSVRKTFSTKIIKKLIDN